MNHIYIGLGEAAKTALEDFYQHYKDSTVDKGESLHAEFMAVTDAEQKNLYLFDNLQESSAETSYKIHSIIVEPPSIRNALVYLRDHRWLKMDEDEQSYWAELIDIDVQEIERMPRRIIRLNLADAIDNLLKQVHSAYLRLQNQFDDEGLALHLLVDASNEWVKAILTDVVVQLRQHYPSLFCRLNVFVLLPANFSLTKLEALQSTSLYATLVEFNALLNNQWMPENLLNILPLSEDGNWVNACYLVEKDNERYDISGLSSLLLRKSFVSETVWQGFFEDEYARYEQQERVKNPNFVSFGLLQLAVTVDYPTEYYKKLFSVQVLNALLYANWQEKAGFVSQDNYETRQEFVHQLERLIEEWCLDSDYLRLNKLMTNDQSKLHPKWASIETEWERNREERLNSAAEASSEREQVLLQKYTDYYEQRFRLKGVEPFYELEWTESRLDALAFKLLSGIEKSLIKHWWNYDRGLADLPAMILTVLEYLSTQSHVLEKERREYEQKDYQYTARYQSTLNSKSNSKVKFRLFGGGSGELSELDEDLYQAFCAKTHVKALLFAARLLNRLTAKLMQLHEQISEIFNRLALIRDKYAKILQQIDQISAKGTWVSHQRDVHMQQVSLNVYLEIDKMRQQIFAQPFEIKSHVKKFKNQLREQFAQQANFNMFSDHLAQKEFGVAVEKISDAYADHLDFLLSGKNKRPETSELITAAVNLTPQNKLVQFREFLRQVLTQPQQNTYVPSLLGIQQQIVARNAKMFAPQWIQNTDSSAILGELLDTSHLTNDDVNIGNSLSNYLDLINVYQLDVKKWPAISHIASVYQNSLNEYEDMKRAFFQWHSEHRLVGWLEHALIEPEYSLETKRYLIVKAFAMHVIYLEFKEHLVRITKRDTETVLTEGGWVSLVDLLDSIKISNFVVLERALQTSEVVNQLQISFQLQLEQLLNRLKQSLFALENDDDDDDWATAGMFVAWQRTTQKVLNDLN